MFTNWHRPVCNSLRVESAVQLFAAYLRALSRPFSFRLTRVAVHSKLNDVSMLSALPCCCWVSANRSCWQRALRIVAQANLRDNNGVVEEGEKNYKKWRVEDESRCGRRNFCQASEALFPMHWKRHCCSANEWHLTKAPNDVSETTLV